MMQHLKNVEPASASLRGLIQGDALELVPRLEKGSVALTVTSPPYYVGKAYDTSTDLREFKKLHEQLLPAIIAATREGGSVCWQVGYHVKNGVLAPLDYLVHSVMADFSNVFLRNRITWTFGHGMHATKRFSGRHETVLWYTVGRDYHFDLDAVRVPQKYPGKRRYKGDRKGEFSGNPKGKNPSDVWEFPNVKAKHPEKTEHPCQFPVALARRLIRALSPKDGLILDPFAGSGSTAVGAILEGRPYVAIERGSNYFSIAEKRCREAVAGTLKYRDDRPAIKPDPKWKVSQRPANFIRPEEHPE